MSTNENQPKNKGILLTEGAELTIHGFRITLGPEVTGASHDGVTLRQDLCRYWMRIAFDHTREAVLANEELRAAEERKDDKGLAGPLEREFRSSMQAVLSAAVALDAFYASVKDRIYLPADQVAAWKKNKTARWKQMAEVFRLAFDLKPEGFRSLREHLKTITKYRNWAVHPPADSQRPILHPDIKCGVEWRFIAFRQHNAVELTSMAIAIVHSLIGKVTDDSPLGKYTKGLQQAVDEIAEHWIKEFPKHPVTAKQHEVISKTV